MIFEVGQLVRDKTDHMIGRIYQQVHTHNNPGDVIAYVIEGVDDPEITWFAFEDEIEEVSE